jgi:hypothetical protein
MQPLPDMAGAGLLFLAPWVKIAFFVLLAVFCCWA